MGPFLFCFRFVFPFFQLIRVLMLCGLLLRPSRMLSKHRESRIAAGLEARGLSSSMRSWVRSSSLTCFLARQGCASAFLLLFLWTPILECAVSSRRHVHMVESIVADLGSETEWQVRMHEGLHHPIWNVRVKRKGPKLQSRSLGPSLSRQCPS